MSAIASFNRRARAEWWDHNAWQRDALIEAALMAGMSLRGIAYELVKYCEPSIASNMFGVSAGESLEAVNVCVVGLHFNNAATVSWVPLGTIEEAAEHMAGVMVACGTASKQVSFKADRTSEWLLGKRQVLTRFNIKATVKSVTIVDP